MRSILIVEPEMLIGMVLADFLQESGLQVFSLARGSEAAQFLGRPLSIDAVVTDLRIPHAAEGLSLILWLAENRPDLEVLVAANDAAKAKSAMHLHAIWSDRPAPYDLTAGVSQMRLIINGRRRREQPASECPKRVQDFIAKF